MKKQQENERDEKTPNEIFSTAMQAGICDALMIIGVVLAGDERAKTLLSQSYETIMALAPQRLGSLDQMPALALEGYQEPLRYLMRALHAREPGRGPLSTH